jgi:hypothetical protein
VGVWGSAALAGLRNGPSDQKSVSLCIIGYSGPWGRPSCIELAVLLVNCGIGKPLTR